MKIIINTPCPSVEISTSFYSKLGFNLHHMEGSTLVYDQNVKIIIDHSRKARLGFRLYLDNLSESINKLDNDLFEIKNKIYSIDPNGIIISLHPLDEYPQNFLEADTKAITGNFAGISIESLPFKNSISFYKKLGFNISMGDGESGWIQMNGFDIDLSIMKMESCPHLFHNPSLTYFNGKEGNPLIIEKIRNAGIEFDEEITVFNDQGIVDNVILKDPGGLGFFIFND